MKKRKRQRKMLKAKVGKRVSEHKDSDTEIAVMQFVNIKREIDELNVKLKEQKAVLSQKARDFLSDDDASTITFSVDEDSVKVSFGWDVKVDDEGKLQDILGKRFEDLVKTSVVFKPVDKLRVMAIDDDGIRECLIVKEKAPAVSVVK